MPDGSDPPVHTSIRKRLHGSMCKSSCSNRVVYHRTAKLMQVRDRDIGVHNPNSVFPSRACKRSHDEIFQSNDLGENIQGADAHTVDTHSSIECSREVSSNVGTAMAGSHAFVPKDFVHLPLVGLPSARGGAPSAKESGHVQAP